MAQPKIILTILVFCVLFILLLTVSYTSKETVYVDRIVYRDRDTATNNNEVEDNNNNKVEEVDTKQPPPECHQHNPDDYTQERLIDELSHYDWSELEPYFKGYLDNLRIPPHLIKRITDILVPFVEQEPVVPIEVHERPVPLNKTLNCASNYRSILTGEERKEYIPKVYDLFPFNSELDLLEMRLYELDDVVDKFVIIEETHSHRGSPKPLFYARNMERFSRFQDKIIHIIADYSELLQFNAEKDGHSDHYWGIETWTRDFLWEKFMKTMKNSVDPRDIIIVSDLDEIPKGDLINHIKYCEEKSTPINVNSIFYRYGFYWTFDIDIHFPMIMKRSDIKPNVKNLCRGCKGIETSYGQGGHFSYFGNAAYNIYKQLTIAEGGSLPYLDVEKVDELMLEGKRFCCAGDKPVPRAEGNWIPWVAEENKERYSFYFRNFK